MLRNTSPVGWWVAVAQQLVFIILDASFVKQCELVKGLMLMSITAE